MGAFFETIPPSTAEWILQQKVIWIASAPLSADGHVNVSPKGGPYFGIVDEKTFWYMDLTGSGVETLSHLHEPGNGRITVLLNAFEGPPKIVRLWGKGVVLEYGTVEYKKFVKENNVKTIAGTRAVVRVDIHQVGTSCGFSMPFFDFKEFRPTLNEFFVKKVANEEKGDAKNGIEQYWAYKNAESMDGLPGMRRAIETGTKANVKPITKMVGPLAPSSKKSTKEPSSISPVVIALFSFFLGLITAVLALEYVRGDLQMDFVNYSEEIPALLSR